MQIWNYKKYAIPYNIIYSNINIKCNKICAILQKLEQINTDSYNHIYHII